MSGLVHRQQQPNPVEAHILKANKLKNPTNPVTL